MYEELEREIVTDEENIVSSSKLVCRRFCFYIKQCKRIARVSTRVSHPVNVIK